MQVRVEQRGNAITRLVKRCPVAFCGAGYRVKAVERLEPGLRCGRKVRGIRAAEERNSVRRDAKRAARANGQPYLDINRYAIDVFCYERLRLEYLTAINNDFYGFISLLLVPKRISANASICKSLL